MAESIAATSDGRRAQAPAPYRGRRLAAGIRRRLGQVGLAVTMICLLFPIYWVLQSSFSTQVELFHTPSYLFPPHPSVIGFVEAFPAIVGGLWHSAIISVGAVLVTLFVSLTTGYGILLVGGRGAQGPIRMLILTGLVFPQIMFVIPLYSILFHLHLLNTYPGLILSDTLYSTPLGIMICYTYMATIPPSLLEAPQMDGATRVRILASIVIPLTRPAAATTAIFAFLGAWGDYLFAETFTSNTAILPASIGVYRFIGSASTEVHWPQVMAASLILGIPALLAVFLAQRYIRSGLSAGAIRE